MRITDLRFQRVRARWDYDGPLGEDRNIQPLDIYTEGRIPQRNWPLPNLDAGPPYLVECFFLTVVTDAGVHGMYGPPCDRRASPRRGTHLGQTLPSDGGRTQKADDDSH